MGETIYWKKYDKPLRFFDPFSQKEREQTGNYVCADERVEQFSIVGFLKADKTMVMSGELLMKNGERKSFPTIEIDEKSDERIIAEAEQYLNELE
jgi:hypothetical protein